MRPEVFMGLLPLPTGRGGGSDGAIGDLDSCQTHKGRMDMLRHLQATSGAMLGRKVWQAAFVVSCCAI
jgi:hypothetical protein